MPDKNGNPIDLLKKWGISPAEAARRIKIIRAREKDAEDKKMEWGREHPGKMWAQHVGGGSNWQQSQDASEILDQYTPHMRKAILDRYYGARKIEAPASPTEPNYEKVLDVINAMGEGTAQSLADLGVGTLNLARAGAQKLGKFAPALDPLGAILKTRQPISEKKLYLSPQVERGMSPTIKKAAYYLNPFTFMLPEAKLGEAVGLGAKGAGILSKLGERALTGGATSGLYGGLYSGPGHQKEGAEMGAAFGSPLAMILGTPGAVSSELLSKLIKRGENPLSIQRSPAEAAELMSKLGKDVPINIGDLLNHPTFSKFYHDALTPMPFSGAAGKSQQILGTARKKAGEIVNQLKGKIDPVKIDKYLVKSLNHHYGLKRDISNDMYGKFYKKINDLGIKINTNKLNEQASSLLNEYDHPEMEGLITPETFESLKRVSKIKDNGIDFKNLQKNISAYGKKGDKLGGQGERESSRVYTLLKNAAKDDIEDKVNDLGKPELISELKNANKFYKENVVPFLGKDLTKLRYKTVDPDNIHTILTRGDNLEALKMMDRTSKNAVIYKTMLKALEDPKLKLMKANPFKLTKFYKGLLQSPKKMEALFMNGDKEGTNLLSKFEELKALSEASREPALQENRPFTGGRRIGEAMKYGGVGGLALSYLMPSLSHTIIGSILGSLLLGRGLTNLLTSKGLREAYTTGELPKLLSMGKTAKLPEIFTGMLTGRNNRNS